jgi:CBS domain-containing protein
MTIGELCNREVASATRATSVREAAQMMRSHHVGDLVVVEMREGERYPVGIVTDRDIVVSVVAAAVDADALTVGEVMGPGLAAVRESDGVLECVRFMRRKGVRRLPVVDAAGRLAGIVSADDLLALMATELSALARSLTAQPEFEEERRP